MTRGNDFVNMLKTMSAGAIVIETLAQGKPLDKLNTIIRPIISSFLKPNFQILTSMISYFLFNIVKSFEGSPTSPVPKIFKNIFTTIFDEKLKIINSKTEFSPGDLADKKKIPERDYITMGKRHDGFVELIRHLYERNKDQLFTNYPFLLDALTSEFKNLHDVDHLSIVKKNVTDINIVEIYKNLKMMGILRKIQSELFDLSEVITKFLMFT